MGKRTAVQGKNVYNPVFDHAEGGCHEIIAITRID